MAESHEASDTDITSLTAADQALELIRNRSANENAIDWLANELLALAAEADRLTLRIEAGPEGQKPGLACSDAANTRTSLDPGPLQIFRTLLARFAKMAEQENGTPFSPYGGKVHFERSGPAGSVRLDVEIANTTHVQSIDIAKRP